MKRTRRGQAASRVRLAGVLSVLMLLMFAIAGCKKEPPTPAPSRTPGIVLVTPTTQAPTNAPQPSPVPTNTLPPTTAPATPGSAFPTPLATEVPTAEATVAPPTPPPPPTQPSYPGPLPEASLTPGAYPQP